jgi:hypothetical protein
MMNKKGPTITTFRGPIGARFAPIRVERQVGETGAHPSTLGCSKNPPQAVENKKIIDVSDWRRIILFSADTRLAEMGNTLGHLKPNAWASRTARGLH